MSDTQEWTHLPVPERLPETAVFQNLQNELANVILDIIQDGLCIVNTDLDVVYANVAMQHWYSGRAVNSGKKCYELYHGRYTPCEDCPARRAIEMGAPQTGTQVHEFRGKVIGRQRVFCVPLLDAGGKACLVVEYVRDITNEKRAESTVLLLEKQNEILREHLQQKEDDRIRMEQAIARNMNHIVFSLMPVLQSMLDDKSYRKVEEYIGTLMFSPSSKTTAWESKLTEQEAVIARHIMDGLASKEIAEKLNISKKTVDYHRGNIRKKLGISPNANLRQKLAELA